MQAINVVQKTDDTHAVWKEELKEKITNFVLIASEFNRATKEAKPYISGYVPEISYHSNISHVIDEWLEGVCEKANEGVDNISHLKITTEHLPNEYKGLGASRNAAVDQLAEWVINNYDFFGLSQAIDSAKANIEQLGLKLSAKELGLKTGLVSHRHGGKELNVKKVKGRYILEISHYGSWRHDRLHVLQNLKKYANTFERESHTCGLSYCIQMIINEEEALPSSSDTYVPSRTKTAEDSNVSATFFNEKIKLAFVPEVFESLVSFVRDYSEDTELPKIIVG